MFGKRVKSSDYDGYGMVGCCFLVCDDNLCC